MDTQVCVLFSISSDTVCVCENRSAQASFLSLVSLRCPFAHTNSPDRSPWNGFYNSHIFRPLHPHPTPQRLRRQAIAANLPPRRSSTLNPHPPMQLWSKTTVPADQDSASSNRPRTSPGHQDGTVNDITTAYAGKKGWVTAYIELGTQVGICQLDSLENPADGSMCTRTVLRWVAEGKIPWGF